MMKTWGAACCNRISIHCNRHIHGAGASSRPLLSPTPIVFIAEARGVRLFGPPYHTDDATASAGWNVECVFLKLSGWHKWRLGHHLSTRWIALHLALGRVDFFSIIFRGEVLCPWWRRVSLYCACCPWKKTLHLSLAVKGILRSPGLVLLRIFTSFPFFPLNTVSPHLLCATCSFQTVLIQISECGASH